MKRHGWLPKELKVAFHYAVKNSALGPTNLTHLGALFVTVRDVKKVQPHFPRAIEIAKSRGAYYAVQHLREQIKRIQGINRQRKQL